MYLKYKAFKYLQNQSFFSQFQVTFHMYLNIGRDNDYDDGESSNKIPMSNMMIKNMH